MTSTLQQVDRGIWLLQMTRPDEMNTLTLELLGELDAAIDRCTAERARALVLTGAERAFCCGAHLKYFAGAAPRFTRPQPARDEYLAHIAAAFNRLEAAPYPTIAAVNGYALGGGCELALSCDLRVMAEDARLGLPETRLGAVAAAGGVQKLARHVGRARALDWILRARHIDARSALAAGLVSDVVPRASVVDRALDLARELRRLGPAALAQSKYTIYAAETIDLASATRYGIDALSLLVGGDEWNEGMAAFVEKRAPRFEEW